MAVTYGNRSHLTLYLSFGYVLLIIYASLYPLQGWHDGGSDPLAFLGASWPRYFTGFDLTANALAYVPLGFLCAASLRRRMRPFHAFLVALVLGIGLSLGMEILQNYLPSRVPSNLDLACNAAGTLLGGLFGAVLSARALDEGRLARWRQDLMRHSHGADLGVLLVVAWLLSQLSPEALLFGNGNLRRMLELPPAQSFQPDLFTSLETFAAAAGLLAAGLIITLLLRRHARLLTAAVLLAAVLIKALSYALLMGPAAFMIWITPGNKAGMLIGLALWWSASFLSISLQRAVAAMALLFATVMVNIGPENPYLLETMNTWNPGQFLNFNGLTRLISSLWPFIALPWLMIYRPDSKASM
ncbi:MAG: VanZ family protein [Sulfuritalea sp.]|nr:VanZ family protein [Sulfuritalea sp.]